MPQWGQKCKNGSIPIMYLELEVFWKSSLFRRGSEGFTSISEFNSVHNYDPAGSRRSDKYGLVVIQLVRLLLYSEILHSEPSDLFSEG